MQTATQAYGVAFENPNLFGGITSARAAFVIDEQGIIIYSEQTESTKVIPNFKAIKAAVGGTI
jgi:peroxiredoxin